MHVQPDIYLYKEIKVKAFKYTEKGIVYGWTNYGMMEITLKDEPYFGLIGKPVEIRVPKFFKEEELREFLDMYNCFKLKPIARLGCDGFHTIYAYKNRVVEVFGIGQCIIAIHNIEHLYKTLKDSSTSFISAEYLENEFSKLKAIISKLKKGK
jgi:hypothetical protein